MNGEKVCNIFDEGRLVDLAAMGDGSEEGRVGLEQGAV